MPTIKLANGFVHDGKLYTEVTHREMNGYDEDMLRDRNAAKRSKGNPIDDLLLGCVEAFGDITDRATIQRVFQSNLLLPDYHLLLLSLRVATHGPDYSFTLNCPHCETVSTYRIDLDELEVTEQPEQYRGKAAVLVDIPGLGQAEVRQLVVKDQAALEHIAATYPKERGTRELLYQVASINGELPTIEQFRKMSLRHRNALRNATEEMVGGVNTTLDVECTSVRCGRGFQASMPLNLRSFFFQGKVGSGTPQQVSTSRRSGATLTSWLNASGGPPTT